MHSFEITFWPYIVIFALVLGLIMVIQSSRKNKVETKPVQKTDLKKTHLDYVRDPDVSFSRSRLMNGAEYQVYQTLMSLLSSSECTKKSLLLFTQVPGSALIEVAGKAGALKKASNAIRYKIFDFVIINGSGYPLAVVEYNGEGHYQSNAQMRDAVKKEACQRAGIAFIAIEGEEKPNDYRLRVLQVLNAPASKRALLGEV